MSDAPETATPQVTVIYTGLDPWTTPAGRLVEHGEGPIDLPAPVAERLIARGWAVEPDTTPPVPKRRTATSNGEDN